MPRNNITLQIFLASPSDVVPEREAVRAIVDELNSTWSKSLGISLEVFGWEANTHPAFSTDCQAVINEQSPDDYDLFIAVLWTRLGTPTPRADSGTIEEFDRALTRLHRDRSSIELMIFFKNEAVPPSDIDVKQLAGVNHFRDRVVAEGGLYREFKSIAEFENTLRLSLTHYVQGWAQHRQQEVSTSRPITPSVSPPRTTTVSDEPEELGFIDLVEEIVESTDILIGVGTRMGGALTEFADEINLRTEELKKSTNDGRLATTKRVTNRLAANMDRFVAVMQVELSGFSEHYEETFTKAGQVASIALDFADRTHTASQLIQLADQMATLRGNFMFSAKAMRGLRDIIASTPRLTTLYTRAKRSTIGILDSVAGELELASSSAEQAEITIRSLVTPELNY